MAVEKKRIPFVYPPLSQEIANAVTHGAGAALSAAGAILLIIRAVPLGALAVVGACLYGASLMILYLASCLYHALKPGRAKRVFRILDHCSIFVLIFGTYIPVSWMLLGTALGWTVFGIIGGCAALGITLNAVSLERFNRFSQILYLAAGWAIVLTAPIVYRATSFAGICLLVGGGLFYTVGTYFFRFDKRPFYHAIWHLFVLGGSVMHFFFIYQCCFAY